LQSDYNGNKCDWENKQYVHHQVLYWLQGSCNRNTFDDIEHQQKVEISYKVNMGSNWSGIFLKYIIGVPTWCGKKDPPCWD